jgi:hypothetical protein
MTWGAGEVARPALVEARFFKMQPFRGRCVNILPLLGRVLPSLKTFIFFVFKRGCPDSG